MSRQLRNTYPSSSYFTLARGGYITRISPGGNRNGRGPHLEPVDEIGHRWDRVPQAHPEGHGQKDPDREVAVKDS